MSPDPQAGEEDVVNPSHYSTLNPEPIVVITSWGLDWPLSNVIKYLVRAGKKPGVSKRTDLLKAQTYLNYALTDLAND